jgi:uncharacterized protein YkwD
MVRPALIFLFMLVVFFAVGLWVLENSKNNQMPLYQLAKVAEQIKVEPRVITPLPLRDFLESDVKNLSIAGVLSETNKQRSLQKLSPLALNDRLNAVASRKLNDLFSRQYFDHLSPDGLGPGDLAVEAGYSYMLVGENLALGLFAGDASLVGAWMNSPGHRENIMHPSFTEIGIAVGKGTYAGTATWIAVQTFGQPLTVCPTPNPAYKQTYEQSKAAYDALVAQLEKQGVELEAEKVSLEKLAIQIEKLEAQRQSEAAAARRSEYNKRVNDYETARILFNSLLTNQTDQSSALNTLIDQLNKQIVLYNQCVSQSI